MALPVKGSVTVDEDGNHTGSGLSLEMYEARKAAAEENIMAQEHFEPVPFLEWLAADSVAQASKIHDWLTVDADVEVEHEGTRTGVIT